MFIYLTNIYTQTLGFIQFMVQTETEMNMQVLSTNQTKNEVRYYPVKITIISIFMIIASALK